MSSSSTDISWQVLRRIAKEWAGESAELSEVVPLEGGMINTTLLLKLADGARAVLKISAHRVNRDYEREAHQLDLLRELGLPAPRVHLRTTGSLDDPNSYILMEYMEGVDLAEAKRRCTAEQFDALQQELARIVLRMHERTSDAYHRVVPGIGNGDGNGGDARFAEWSAFLRHVYDPVVKEAEKHPAVPIKARKALRKIHDRLDRLVAHGDVPRLVHWDIWSTNLLAGPDSDGVWRISAVLDPNCKYAHAEAELAYIDLFHTCNHAFTRAYQADRRLDDAYHRVRKPVYQLYPLVHHVNLFGQEYVAPMLAALDRVSVLV